MRTSLWHAVVWLVVAVAGGLAMAAPAQGGGGPTDATDRELFGGPKDGKPQLPGAADEAIEKRLRRELGAAANREDAADDPLSNIARQMREVQGRMGKRDAGIETQHLQSQIVADLDQLIDQARKSGSRSPSAEKSQDVATRTPMGQSPAAPQPKPGQGGGTTPGQLNNPNAVRKPEGHRPDMGEMRSVLKQIWGELPQRQREQMLELPVEEFLPKYEMQLEEYFRRLSEDKTKQGRAP